MRLRDRFRGALATWAALSSPGPAKAGEIAPGPKQRGHGRQFVAWYLAAVAAAAAAVTALLVAVDPYDSGWPGLVRARGIPHNTQVPYLAYAAASFGRDPGPDSAVLGNSHIFDLDPARLGAATGGRFVQLAVPGAWPLAVQAVGGWFLRHRRTPARMVVLGLDYGWCAPVAEVSNRPFPLWLYGEDRGAYLRGLVQMQHVGQAWRRLRYLAGLDPGMASEGIDRTPGWAWDASDARRRIAATVPPPAAPLDSPLPALEIARDMLARMAPATRVLLVFTPVAAAVQPSPGSVEARRLARCKDGFAALAAARPNTAFADHWIDSPDTRAIEHFWDATHVRGELLRVLERDVIRALDGLRSAGR